jgi:hypothetical protein
MPSPGDIRAGGASVEIRADTTQLKAGLQQAKAQLNAFQAEGAKGGGFFGGGSFRGMELAEGGIRFAVAMQAARVAIQDVKIFSALIRGDMEGMRKAAEALPLGFGEIVKELSGPLDAFFKKLMPGRSGYVYDKAAAGQARRDRQASIDQEDRGAKALAASRKAVRDATMMPADVIRAEVEEMGLSPAAKAEELRNRLGVLAVKEQKARGTKQDAAEKAFSDAMKETHLETLKAVASEELLIKVRTKAEGAEKDWTPEQIAEATKARLNSFAIVTAAEKQKKATDEAEHLRQQTLTEGGERNLAQLKEREQTLKRIQESVKTPEETLRREKSDLDALRGGLGETAYKRAVLAAVMRYSSGLSSVTTRGAFGGMDAAAMRSAGSVDKVADNTARAAAAAEKALPLLRELGMTFD